MKLPTYLSSCFILLLTILLASGCNPKTYDFRKNYDTAFDHPFVKELKGNNLFVKLVNNEEIIANYRSRGKEKSAANWERDDAKHNAAIMKAFKDYWKYCDVFFYDQELYFNTDEFQVTDINGQKHIVELEREQIFIGKFIEFCRTVSIGNENDNIRSNQTHFMLEKWPEDGSRGKKNLKVEAGGCYSKSTIRILVGQMQKRLQRTYEGKRL